MKSYDVDEFIELIRGHVYLGYGFVPLVGSGISAGSGILTGEQFTNYLACTLYRCVVADGPESTTKEPARKWNLKRDGWPQDVRFLKEAKEWIARYFLSIAAKTGFKHAQFLIDKDILKLTGHDTTVAVSARVETMPQSDTSTNASSTLFDLLRPLHWPLVPEIIANRLGFQHNQNLIAIARTIGNLDDLRNFQAPPGISQTSPAFIKEKAIRSLHDWRASLRFMSCLSLDSISGKDNLNLDIPDQWIIDSFNTHITKGRKPNHAHTMLAHLARPLRFRTILTTNFDTLLEETFLEAKHGLHLFPVGIKAGLPDARSVLAQDSIVKLHGEMSDTRADFSLDDMPTDADIKSFRSYINLRMETRYRPIDNHLLVAGLSARDIRIVQFIKHAIDQNNDLKVFWICYNRKDVERIEDAFADDLQNFIVTQTQRLDLLLYELYQKCTLSLPPGGFSFTFTQKIAPCRLQPLDRVADTVSELDDTYLKWAKVIKDGVDPSVLNSRQIDTTGLSGPARMQLQTGGYYTLEGNDIVDHAYGVTKHLEGLGLQCIWIEMTDSLTPQAMLNEILTTISIRRGFFQLDHVELLSREQCDIQQTTLPSSFRERIRTLTSVLRIAPKDWAIFLYGRTVPGASAGWKPAYWEARHYTLLHEMLEVLGCPTSLSAPKDSGPLGFRFVYMPFTESRLLAQQKLEVDVLNTIGVRLLHKKPIVADDNVLTNPTIRETYTSYYGKIAKRLRSKPAQSEYAKCQELDNIALATKDNIDPHFEERAPEKIERHRMAKLLLHFQENWIIAAHASKGKNEEAWQKLQFLYGLLLFRQSRHPNAVLTDAVFRCPERFNRKRLDNDWLRDSKTKAWMRELKNNNVATQNIFLDKPGGYAWIYREDRLSILRIINAEINLQLGTKKRLHFPGQLRGKMHKWIGDWYFKAFCATGHITPLLESFYHRFTALNYVRFDKLATTNWASRSERLTVTQDRLLGYHESLNLLLKSFSIARPWLQFWLSESATIDWLGTTKLEMPPMTDVLVSDNPRALDAIASLKGKVLTMTQQLQATIDGIVEGIRSGRKRIRLPTATLLLQKASTPVTELYAFDMSTVPTKCFRSHILALLGTEQFDCFRPDFKPGDEDAIAKARRKWLFTNVVNQPRLCIVVQLLGDFAYLHVRRAKLVAHASGKTLDGRATRTWVEVCMICYEALKLCPHLDAVFVALEVLLQIKLLTIYGLALGHLGRFFEAHRRLDEAEALLSKQSIAVDPIELAKIKLRRGEVCLLEAEDAKQIANSAGSPRSKECSSGRTVEDGMRAIGGNREFRENILRLSAAKIDDAWVLLESSRQLLGGKSHSSLWWGRWITLCWRTYDAGDGSEFDTLPFRRVIDQRSYISRLFEKSGLITELDGYYQVRFVDYYCSAVAALNRRLGASEKELGEDRQSMRARLETVRQMCMIRRDDDERYLKRYFRRILRKVEMF